MRLTIMRFNSERSREGASVERSSFVSILRSDAIRI